MPTGRRHYRITLGDALEAHAVALQFGGLAGVRNQSQVEAAIGRPYSGYFRPIALKAAAIFEAVIESHGFVDGNKRTAILLTDLLIKKSGYRLAGATAREDLVSEIEDLAVAVANGDVKLAEIAAWFKPRLERAR